MQSVPQRLPATGPAREALREKGQFWTPDWVAQAMVGYVLQGEADHLFDPAVGAGAFFKAAKAVGQHMGRQIALLGAEIDLEALRQAAQNGLTTDDLASVQMSNFVLEPPARRFNAIVANPPYIRHHRLPAEVKAHLKAYSAALLGTALDGRAGLHIYFLLRALELLDARGRLAFIMPADTCEGVFAPPLWEWITRHYRLDGVVTFTPAASPFPQVDTNPLIFLIRHAEPASDFWWAQCTEAETAGLYTWIASGFGAAPDGPLRVHCRQMSEGLATGLSRPPADERQAGLVLGDVARVWRGIATGANDFFFLTREQATALDIPDEFLRLAVGRTRDVEGDEITPARLQQLEAAGRPTLLLSLDGRPFADFPPSVQRYLLAGEKLGLPQRPLIAQRRPWYKMEARAVPPLLFAYLGRRNARFIRNTAGVLPLTGFLCVYPRQSDPVSLEKLWRVLSHPDTIANLALVGKSYGAGAIKVEPRALERLPLAGAALRAAELEEDGQDGQMALF
jgi:adenine-specific DNA-methyltransferase